MQTKKDLSITANKVLNFEFQIPASSEFVSVIRLAISGIASRMNFNIDEIEDIKISVSEACTNVIHHAFSEKDPTKQFINLSIEIRDKKFIIYVKDNGMGFNTSELGSENQVQSSQKKLGLGLGLEFVKNLMEDVKIESSIGSGTTIRMCKTVSTLS